MKINSLKIYTNKLDLEKKFYSETLGFEIIKSDSTFFSLKIGWSILTFEKSKQAHIYHYCFLIPSNKLTQALEWIERRVKIIPLLDRRKTQRFETWNADSFYFHDASGNIAEFIVRHELNNTIHCDFDITNVCCINEIGMPTTDIKRINTEIEKCIGTKFWKGDLNIFGTNGSQNGLFLLPNYKTKDTWFPTSIKIKPEPLEIVIENNEKKHFVKFNSNGIKIIPIT